jgi:type IV pilus assembly protein PilM
VLLDNLKSLLLDPPPGMVFEVSEAGIAAARIGHRTEIDFRPLEPGVLEVSPLKENVLRQEAFTSAVKALATAHAGRKGRDAALILPDFSTRTTVLDFDSFPAALEEQLALIRFRLKRSVPFDVDTAAVSFYPQPGPKRVDVVVVMAPSEIVARFEAPFRDAGLNPGLVTTSSLAALDLAPEGGRTMVAKVTGRSLTLLVRDKAVLKLVRCLELPSSELEDITAVLAPTFVYMEDNLGGRAEKLLLCGFGARADEAKRRFADELAVEVDELRSPLGVPGEHNAGLLGYLRSVARNN